MDISVESLEISETVEPAQKKPMSEKYTAEDNKNTEIGVIDLVDLDASVSSVDSEMDSPIQHLDDSELNGIDLDDMMDEMLEEAPQNLDSIVGHHTFRIDDLQKMLIEKEKFRGPTFQVGNYKFNLIMVCQKKQDYSFSVYLEGHPADEGDDVNEDSDDSQSTNVWSFPVHFSFYAWDPTSPSLKKVSNTRFRFNQRVTDWGFVQFLDKKHAIDSQLFARNKINFTVFVRVIDDFTGVLYSDYRDYDSKKYTGYVGIENQGATCYLNSLLQSYFFTKSFRKRVYQIPTENEISLDVDSYEQYKHQSKSVTLALQRIFYKLQTSDVAINSLELTHSFGWTTDDAFTQHDVQEMNRILMDKLESQMKGTDIEDCLNDIFVGKMNSFIRCISVDYESSRTEDFWDIQLNVKGLKNIQESFANYIEREMLDGDNQYDASGFGLQDAEKGVIFEQFPDVLHIQLKRYEYNFETDDMAKINDKYEFSDSLDLSPYVLKTPENSDEDWEYKLHGVLIHQGDVSGGHYYAMIKVTEEDKWFKFDDDRVTRVTDDTVFKEGFGCDTPLTLDRNMTREEQMNHIIKHQTSAYMLVYIRKNKVASVLAPVTESDVPAHIPKQIAYENEQEEKIRREREEMRLYVDFKIYTDESFMHHQGFDIGPNDADRHNYNEELFSEDSYPSRIKLLKTAKWSTIYDSIMEKYNIDGKNVDQLRLWNMVQRSNHTFRPDAPINDMFESLENATIGDVCTALENGTSRRKYAGPDRPMMISLYLEDASKDLKHFANKSGTLSNNSFGKDRVEELFKITDVQNDDASLEPIDENSNILTFVKFFSIEDQSLTGLSHIVLPITATTEFLAEILKPVLNINGIESAVFCEEQDFTEQVDIEPRSTFFKSELGNGDIICVALTPSPGLNVKYSTSQEFYNYMETRIHFQFSPLEIVDEDEEDYVVVDSQISRVVIDAWVSYHSDYSDFTEIIGRKIGVAPEYIKMSHFANGRKTDLKLDFDFARALSKTSKSHTIKLSYEVLKIPLQEFEGMELCHVFWVGNGICKEERHEFFLPRNSTLENVIEKLCPKINLSIDVKDEIFCWTADHYRKVSGILNLSDTIDGNMFLIMGIFPNFNEIRTKSPSDMTLIRGFQCNSSTENVHGLPFLFDLVDGEELSCAFARLRKLLGLSETEFKHVKIALHHSSAVDYIDLDTNVDLFKLSRRVEYSIVVDHRDKKSRYASHQSSIKIM